MVLDLSRQHIRLLAHQFVKNSQVYYIRNVNNFKSFKVLFTYLLCFPELETVKKGTPLYGQPEWWGEEESDLNLGNKCVNQSHYFF